MSYYKNRNPFHSPPPSNSFSPSSYQHESLDYTHNYTRYFNQDSRIQTRPYTMGHLGDNITNFSKTLPLSSYLDQKDLSYSTSRDNYVNNVPPIKQGERNQFPNKISQIDNIQGNNIRGNILNNNFHVSNNQYYPSESNIEDSYQDIVNVREEPRKNYLINTNNNTINYNNCLEKNIISSPQKLEDYFTKSNNMDNRMPDPYPPLPYKRNSYECHDTVPKRKIDTNPIQHKEFSAMEKIVSPYQKVRENQSKISTLFKKSLENSEPPLEEMWFQGSIIANPCFMNHPLLKSLQLSIEFSPDLEYCDFIFQDSSLIFIVKIIWLQTPNKKCLEILNKLEQHYPNAYLFLVNDFKDDTPNIDEKLREKFYFIQNNLSPIFNVKLLFSKNYSSLQKTLQNIYNILKNKEKNSLQEKYFNKMKNILVSSNNNKNILKNILNEILIDDIECEKSKMEEIESLLHYYGNIFNFLRNIDKIHTSRINLKILTKNNIRNLLFFFDRKYSIEEIESY